MKQKYVFTEGYSLEIDTEKLNFVFAPPAHGLAEAFLEQLPIPHYDPLRDFKPIEYQKAEEICRVFGLPNEYEPILEHFDTRSVQIVLSMYEYLLRAPYPIVLWPELGMHLEQQEHFMRTLVKAGITKGIFITDSVFIPGGHDELFIGFSPNTTIK